MVRKNDLLTDAEMIEFTGCKQPIKQKEVLDRGGVSYIQDREGRPMVTWTHINAVLNGQITIQLGSEEKPNFEAI
ncbi:MAG: DUF4224 domain-containing protein [Klebsiella huaxiensis]|uniref:DUF4224 domain-containing protein n=1 Tax=Klebsiella TaxID=570 RepID=UPI000F8E33C1|nr:MULTISPECIES: DUF4224 domain-containing protein [Klebsiella]ELI6990599.1 DUF4224 domain-containing protein [Klebsiella pneumoniae]EKT8243926.1 DUF4224 domain-containing protein [Klebsiella oxytoca]MCW1903833.1 DUF4224 domain-containing protein [Klebsiella oxytoca]RUS54939.1 hypothetical protein B7L13_08465 [Klebsiella oxytoca]WEJ90422.1 MAG: DUF4224 domain-containing protein [Klebsiella huaxiensis]